MGQVLSTEAIINGSFPEFADGLSQHNAAREISRHMNDIQENTPRQEQPFYWQTYGSALFYNCGDGRAPNRRSDVDFLSVVDHLGRYPTVAKIDEMLAEVSGQFDVTLGHSRMDTQGLIKGRADPFYSAYLRSMRVFGGFSKDLSRLYSTEEQELFKRIFYEPDLETCIAFVNADLDRRKELFANIASRPTLEQHLRYPFELPRNLGRKITELYHRYCIEFESEERYNGETDDFTMPDRWSYPSDPASNFEIVISVLQPDDTFGFSSLKRLVEFDAEYTDILEATIRGDLTIGGYSNWLKGVREQSIADSGQLLITSKHVVDSITAKAGSNPMFGREKFILYGGSDTEEEDIVYGIRLKEPFGKLVFDDQLRFASEG
jgi:hypothetical protein